MKTASDDMFILDMNKVLTISESDNLEIISVYQQYIRESDDTNPYSSKESLNREMGYISSVIDAKEVLEKLYKLWLLLNLHRVILHTIQILVKPWKYGIILLIVMVVTYADY